PRAGRDPKLVRRHGRLVHIRSDVPIYKQTALTWRKKPSRSRCNHTFTQEINYERNHALRPPGRALRGAPRPDDYRTDGRHHANLGGLRMRVRPVALPWHRIDHPAEADGPRVLRDRGGGR